MLAAECNAISVPDVLEVKSLFIEKLILLCDRYCETTGQTRASVSKAIHGRGGQIDDLAAGRRDLTTSTAESAVQWFSDHWPADLEWPEGVSRPAPGAPVMEAAE